MAFYLSEAIFLVLAILSLYIVRFYYAYFTRPSPLPGPFPFPLFGNMLTYPGDMLTWSNHHSKIYGDFYEVYMGTQRTFWLCRGDLCEKIFSSSRANNFLLRTPPNDGLDEFDVSKKGLLFNRDLDNWRFYRKFMSRVMMTPKFLKETCEWVQDIWGEMEEYWQENDGNLKNDSGKVLDLSGWALRVTTDSIIHLTTHKKAYSLASYHKKLSPNSVLLKQVPKSVLKSSDKFVGAIRMFIDSLAFFMSTPWITRRMPGVKERVRELIRNRDWLNEDLLRIIRERREEVERLNDCNTKDHTTLGESKNIELRTDLLTMLLTVNTNLDITKGIGDEINCNPITDDEIREIMIEVFAGGIDTTANTICYVIYHLEHHPNVKQRFLKELDSTFGRDPNYRFKIEDLSKLEYSEAIIKEVQRVFPTTPINFRANVEPCEIGGCKFPADTQFFVNNQSVNSHPAHWTNPHEFNPDRFLSNPIDPKQPKQTVYNSFGGGLRMCPGKNIAMMQLKAFMVLLYRKWEIELLDMNAPIKNHFTIVRQCDTLE
ncbi:16627_t:CDS:2, partial [Acaulospora morrowiae]